MNIHFQDPRPQDCQRHNQPVLLYHQNQPLCHICLTELPGIISVDQIYQKLQEIQSKENKENQYQHSLLKSLESSLASFKIIINQNFEKIILQIQKKIVELEQQHQQFLQRININNNLQNLIIELEKKFAEISNNNNLFRHQIQQQLVNLQSKWNNIKPTIEFLECQSNFNKFQYQLIKQFSQQLFHECKVMEFNKDDNILFFGCLKEIYVCSVSNGIIELKQKLNSHKDNVFCLHYMKQKSFLASGSKDHLIIIWKFSSPIYGFPEKILRGHTDSVNCLQMNKKENLLISGSFDKQIKFWKFQNDDWSCTQTIDTQNLVYELSLNDMGDKLISCGYCLGIFIFRLQQDQKWELVQMIKVNQFGYRLSFTIKDQFVFQPQASDFLEVYDYDKQNKQFYKLQEVQTCASNKCTFGFRYQYCKQLKILIAKNGNMLNILNINQEGKYQVVQTIVFENIDLQGRMTDDGQQLITLDNGTKEIQLRKLTYLEQLNR